MVVFLNIVQAASSVLYLNVAFLPRMEKLNTTTTAKKKKKKKKSTKKQNV